jgi:hypothetical protein
MLTKRCTLRLAFQFQNFCLRRSGKSACKPVQAGWQANRLCVNEVDVYKEDLKRCANE